jgi:MoaA/NifB/PqqE/SkfB family radical SAM enzyme
MRKKHLEVLKRRVLSADLPWLAAQAGKFFGVPASWYVRRPLTPPIFGGMVVTYRCNESCPMCNVRRKADPAREMDTPAMLALADQMADLGVSGVSITGGEPLVREDVVEVVARLKARGVPVSMSTNGLKLVDMDLARRLIGSGIDAVAVSLDGADAAEHDASRGRRGAFDRTLEAVRNLLAARAEDPGRHVHVTLATVVSAANYRRFEDILKLARDLGVDNVSLNPVHDTYAGAPAEAPDLYFDAADRDLAALPGTLLELKRCYGLLDSSEAYLRHLADFLAGKPMPARCYAPYFSVFVDCFGDVLPCGGHFYAGKAACNLDGRTLGELWRDPAYQATRDKLRRCRCCYYSCMAELNLTYAKFP